MTDDEQFDRLKPSVAARRDINENRPVDAVREEARERITKMVADKPVEHAETFPPMPPARDLPTLVTHDPAAVLTGTIECPLCTGTGQTPHLYGVTPRTCPTCLGTGKVLVVPKTVEPPTP